MPIEPDVISTLSALAAHFSARRNSILQGWRSGVLADPELQTANSLPRTQFFDHIPQILDGFERSLRAAAGLQSSDSKENQKVEAASHGLQRWQQGYDLREVTVEWGRLHLCLADELEQFCAAHPDATLTALAVARRKLTKLCSDGISESTSQYFKLQQAEAEGHARDLGHALNELRQLEQQRAELWRQAAHDLRGNLGVVVNATEIMRLTGAPQLTQDAIFDSLQRSVSSMHSMLNDVLSLARLQAGQEQRDVKPFDVATVLRELCQNLQSLATERGLLLKTAGPPTLEVQGDPVKILRIAQNLLLNALKYTSHGGVTVSWGASRKDDPNRWMLTVEDTGPGFHAGPGAPVVEALESATEEARHVNEAAGKGNSWKPAGENLHAPAMQGDDRPVRQEAGEGIGLSIVKRLSELLLASIEVESQPGRGTILRVVFPRSYSNAEVP